MPGPRAIHASLAGFDREIGLDATPRPPAAKVEGDAPPVADLPTAVVPRASHGSPSRSPDFPPVPVPAPPPARESSRHVIPAELLGAAADRDSRARLLARIDERHAAACPHCTTATGHTRLVFGEGAPDAEIVFVGEAPGETEDQVGRPFAGRAGEKLDEMIRAMGLRREDVYVANVLKSRPPGNRTPMPSEVDACGPFLTEQILAVRPRVIVTLGGPATQWVCGTAAGISRLRGTWQRWLPPAGADCGEIPVMPTYHPSYVLRTYTPQVRGEVWGDLRAVLAKLGRTPPVRGS